MSKTNQIINVCLIALLLGCTDADKNINESSSEKIVEEVQTKSKLEIPVLMNFPENGHAIDTNAQIESVTFPFYVNSSPADTIYYNDTLRYHIKNPFYQSSMEFTPGDISKTNELKLFVDDSQSFAWKFWEPGSIESFIVELDEDGNEIPNKPSKPSYENVEKTPVFIFNPTDSLQGIENHDGALIVVQEALTKKGEWKPIEFFQFSGCGNSYAISVIDTNSFLMFGINKYSGDFKTKLRVRLYTNHNIILSKEFDGSVNLGQFEEREASIDRRGWNRYLKDNKW
ncbi:MAG: hypothetical protein COA32_10285 [Fluviicola sp.]|nr:MAG: hypothetical protein COA32_10285 [Fluviicola sp.]